MRLAKPRNWEGCPSLLWSINITVTCRRWGGRWDIQPDPALPQQHGLTSARWKTRPIWKGFARALTRQLLLLWTRVQLLRPHLPVAGPCFVMARHTARMAQAVEAAWGHVRGDCRAAWRGSALGWIEVVETAHPVLDGQRSHGVADAGHGAGVWVEMTALPSAGVAVGRPAEGVSLADKQAVHRALLRSGASISQMNILRKQLSAIKGGHLAVAAHPAQVVTLLISDVLGDDLAIIASGQLCSTHRAWRTRAASNGARHGLDLPPSVSARLASGQGTPPTDHPVFAAAQTRMIATPMAALRAAQTRAEALWPGLNVVILGDALEGEARDLGQAMAGVAQSILRHGAPFSAPVLLLSGGETTVTIGQTKPGRGGRNSEFLLSFATYAPEGVYALACDTDGIDGAGTNAGAIWSPRVAHNGTAMDKNAILAAHDALRFFEVAEGVVTTGPTHTNVNDFRAILIPADATR